MSEGYLRFLVSLRVLIFFSSSRFLVSLRVFIFVLCVTGEVTATVGAV